MRALGSYRGAPAPSRVPCKSHRPPRVLQLHVTAFLEERIKLAKLRRENQLLLQQAQLQAQNVQPKRPRSEVLRPGIPPATPTNSFRVPDRPSPPLREDDKDGHYVYELGENLTSRYKLLSKLGEGTFGRVLECWDRKHKDYVAIKIVRNIDKYRHAAMIELEVLHTLRSNDPDGTKNCMPLREWFDYRGHVCMVFEKLGPSLFDFLRKNEYRPFPLDLVQDFSRQLIESVNYLHELQLVHTDLKPENILLVSLDYCRAASVGSGRSSQTRIVPASSAIKVIDFGSATFEDQYHSSVVSTRHYRAPEVILGMGWTYPCDLWSVGCIIIELLTGDALFQTHENLEHLAMMEQVLGPIPASLAQRANKAAAKYFARDKLLWPDSTTNKKSIKAVKKLTNLRRLLQENGDSSAVPYLDILVDLLTGLLTYEPSERMTAAAALNHPFFKLQLSPSIPQPLPSPQLLQGATLTNQQPQQQHSQQGSQQTVLGSVSGLVQQQTVAATPSASGLAPGALPLLVAAGRNAGLHLGW